VAEPAARTPAAEAGTTGGQHEWERPGSYLVAPGVHRIPLPLPDDGLHAVNVYAIEDGDGLVLIDSGWALDESRAQLEYALGTLGHDLGSIRQFLITHVHRDHYTQSIVLRRLFGAKVSLGIDEAPGLMNLLDTAEHLPAAMLARLLTAGAASLVKDLCRTGTATDPVDLAVWDEPDTWLHGGSEVRLEDRRLAVIATPGHTRGHVVFHDPDARLLFAGDHVLPHITPSIGFETIPPPSPLGDYLASLDIVGALADSMLLPAHGPVQPSTAARVDGLREHHRIRLDDTYAAVVAGHANGFDVAGALHWTSRRRRFDELNHFNQMLAVNETLAHLDVLVEQGRLRDREINGVRIFYA
jgi:glyoxylase-like metal-dependent hydrolase (beta-lactamase superfamily II)